MSAHRLSALLKSDEIVVLSAGHIIQRGNHETLIKESGWYHTMYRYQQLEAALDEPEQEVIEHE